MQSLAAFDQFRNKYKAEAEMYIVYISEAHPLDGWHLNTATQPKVSQHASINDRLTAVKYFAEETRKITTTPILVDDMTNEVDEFFQAHPERLVIMDGSKVFFIGGEGPFGYSIEETESNLKRLLNQ